MDNPGNAEPLAADFTSLAASRRQWIDTTLRNWCRRAPLSELKKAAAEWFDIAGRADADATLWTWAWERFPAIVHPEMAGVSETHEVVVRLRDGREFRGYPDSRASRQGLLTLVCRDDAGRIETAGPIRIDEILSVIRREDTALH